MADRSRESVGERGRGSGEQLKRTPRKRRKRRRREGKRLSDLLWEDEGRQWTGEEEEDGEEQGEDWRRRGANEEETKTSMETGNARMKTRTMNMLRAVNRGMEARIHGEHKRGEK